MSATLVDWSLAARIARAAAGEGPAEMAAGPDLQAIGERAEEAVLAYTGLTPAEPLPGAEWVSRREWALANLSSMRDLVGPVEQRLAGSLPERGGNAMGAVAGRVLAVEVGALLGLASKRVLGQYEFSMAAPDRPSRLLFVGPNLDAAVTQLGTTPERLLEWVALHEGTHAAHFAAAPWLRGHLGELAGGLLGGAGSDVSLGDLLARARRSLSEDPRGALARFRESDPVSLLASPAARERIASVQATMAAIEGYAEHVMDAAADRLGLGVDDLRAAMERRRQDRSPIFRLISWLLGFELKLRQYREGKAWADAVAADAGISGLNRAWTAPATLPTQAEIARPEAWTARVGAAATA